ncbi:hypothetical protein EST38_g1797 [Candolleomyces aberdarensis]|uniref:Uncharacterized protein n=1 Tax=Candolleomyces aberdarensis TaxID=2316362 RepID=A0A4Q2DW58_9AGAR|nr:hypothetical protein EST38_g1797 [Candolleomyces aberdarensis]
MTMTDEQITDEVLVEELEKMRAVRSCPGSSDELQEFWDIGGGTYNHSPYSPSPEGSEPQHPFFDEPACESPMSGEEGVDAITFPTFVPGPSSVLEHIKRLFGPFYLYLGPECIRTERHYLSGMRALVSQETETPPPSLMLKHADHLVTQSERLLARMEENPNVWGVTTAFLGEEFQQFLQFSRFALDLRYIDSRHVESLFISFEQQTCDIITIFRG